MNWNKLFFALLFAPLFWACSPSENKDITGGTTEDAAIIANLNVAGVMQKGPFAKGSAVTVRGVDCKTFKFTDEVFEGSVKNNNGDFDVKNVTLSSTCALFEVTGVYLSENSGKKTKDKVTLRALTNLKDRKNVNVNLLTHLEYGRVKFLVTEKGMTFAAAKEQAEKDVLAAFNIKDKIEEFENLNIFESGDGNAALLAVSVLMQSDTDVAGLENRMDEFEDSFAENGVWSDSGAKSAITEWVSAAAASGKLDSIRKNIESWGNAAEIPAFEKYVEKFGDDSPDAAQNTMTDSRDGKTYRTVKIGNQVWMAENLNYETEKSYCYNDSTENCAKYGRFYEWNAAMRACPEGWHLPLLEEFKTLVDALGDSAMAGSKLKSTSGWLNDLNGTDDYGFTVLPIGGKSASGKYINKEWLADFWSSTESAVEFAYVLHLGAYFNTAPLDMDEGKYNAFSVRCLQGENDSLRSYILVEDSAVAACKTESTDDCEYGKLTDERNGQEYKTVKIGKQVWMAENLNYETDESYCYNDSAEYCTKYGRLYTWSAALNACPTGWHLPSQNEGMTLYYSVGGRDTAAKMLKSVNGWNDDGAGTDSFGFSALPVGDRDEFNDYENEGRFTSFWTSTENSEKSAGYIQLYYGDDATLGPASKRHAYAVRCVKDVEVVPFYDSLFISRSEEIFDWSVPKGAYLNPDIQYDSIVDNRDGQVYKTVKIGERTWMAENLNYSDSATTPSLKGKSWCFDNDPEKCKVTGRLYTWAAAIDSVALANDVENPRTCGYPNACKFADDVQGICPSGWHLPSYDEWNTLVTELGNVKAAGPILKSQIGWNKKNGVDEVGFSALPSGVWDGSGDFGVEGAYFWSATDVATFQSDQVRVMALENEVESAILAYAGKYFGLSVRCVKD